MVSRVLTLDDIFQNSICIQNDKKVVLGRQDMAQLSQLLKQLNVDQLNVGICLHRFYFFFRLRDIRQHYAFSRYSHADLLFIVVT